MSRHLPAALGRLRHYAKSDDIWRPEAPSDRVYLVQRGHVAVVYADVQGHEVVLRTVEEGQLLGELCFCTPEQSLRATFARSTVETEVLEVKYSEFVNYLQGDLAALQGLLFVFCTRLGETERRAEILMYRSADERLSRLLLQLAETRGHPHKAGVPPESFLPGNRWISGG